MVMKNRTMSGWVTVTGPPAAIWKHRIADPDAVRRGIARLIDVADKLANGELQAELKGLVPEYNPVVAVEGAVNSPSTVLYREGQGLGYYIENAGGYAENADEGRTHVRYANGATRVKHKFLLFGSSPRPEAGSVVIVPAKPDSDGSDFASILASVTSVIMAGVTLAIVAIR